MARGRPDNGLARFERVALVLSGGEALGAYQAGAYAALEKSGVRTNWIAGSGIGAVNAAIIAGNLPHQRIPNLRRFWQQISESGARRRRWSLGGRVWRALDRRPVPRLGGGLRAASVEPVISATDLRELINETVDFSRVNSGAVRVVFGAVNLATGAESFFDNDRHVLNVAHVMAGTPIPGLPPVAIDGQLFGGGTISVSALDDARPADTLCFAIDGYDPLPGNGGGSSRSAREIAAMRRAHDLRRMIALLGECVPPALRGEVDIRRCLVEASDTTITILHLVHEGNAVGLAEKMTDYSLGMLMSRWSAGESDVTASLSHPGWLSPPSRPSGVVVHEVRDGVVAPQR